MLATMVEPARGHPTGLQHLVEEATELRDRLHRITVALGITEDMVADAFEAMARRTGPGPESSSLRVQARAARATAEECRRFAKHLDEVHRGS
jgi:hypothetical protein